MTALPGLEPPKPEPMRAGELLERLRKFYIRKTDFPGGIFIPEVGINKGWRAGVALPQRRCDAIHVGFTSASGQMLTGHEIKISRSDWLHELDQPDKALTWADQCHAWYVVAPRGLVKREELPSGWGLMEPPTNPRSQRVEIVVKAREHPDRAPSWDIVRSIMARTDTLTTSLIAAAVRGQRDAELTTAQVQRLLDSGGVLETPELTPEERTAVELVKLIDVSRRDNWHIRPDLQAIADGILDLERVKQKARSTLGSLAGSVYLLKQVEDLAVRLRAAQAEAAQQMEGIEQ